MKRLASAVSILGIVCESACGASLPPRYVLEHDLGSYRFRRYQKTLESEIALDGNQAQGHTAAYMRRNAQGVEVVTAFVTVYDHPERLTESVREELSSLPGYELSTETLAGQHAWSLRSSSEPAFWIWPSGAYLVKLGVPAGQTVPAEVAGPYAELYPSDLDSYGHARQGATSGGSAPDSAEDEPSVAAEPSSAHEADAANRTLAEPPTAR